MSLKEVFISWWFLFWGLTSLIPLISGFESINHNNYETVSDKWADKMLWSAFWLAAEIVFVLIILGISKLLKFI